MARIQVQITGGVARLALANPPFNTLDRAMMLEMAKTVRELTQRPSATRPKVILLASDVPHQFCRGLEPEEVLKADIAGRKVIG